jgi:hypothetical protein
VRNEGSDEMKTQVWSKERGAKVLKEGADFETYRAKYPSAIKRKHPSMACMERWHSDGGCNAVDGCWVEPDGECEHGYPSWLRAMCLL